MDGAFVDAIRDDQAQLSQVFCEFDFGRVANAPRKHAYDLPASERLQGDQARKTETAAVTGAQQQQSFAFGTRTAQQTGYPLFVQTGER